MNYIDNLSNFTFIRLLFEVTAISPIKLSEFCGSALRGIFGRALKLSCCHANDINEDCSNCVFTDRCCYRYVFETPVTGAAEIMTKYKTAPHPFVLVLPREQNRRVGTNESFSFELILIGYAINHIGVYVESVSRMGKIGFGPFEPRGRFILEKVSSISAGGKKKTIYAGGEFREDMRPFMINFKERIAKIPPPHGGVLKIRFITPTRIQFEGSVVKKIDFHMLIRNLLRRVNHLNYFHVEGERSDIDFSGLIEKAGTVKTLGGNLVPVYVKRFSSRQNTGHEMRGVMGDAFFEASNATEFIPLLRLGEYINVGKSTAFGMGRYEIV